MGRAEDLFARFEAESEAFIDELLGTRQTEFLFLDYKRSADNGAGRSLHQKDRDNLSKAISGFGNSEGGVIVWGVECDSATDLPSAKITIDSPAQFRAKIESMVTGATVPPHRGVISHAFTSNADPTKGFVVTLVPKSNDAPHRRLWGSEGYYARSGSDFKLIGHDTLAGMFGRRPTPELAVSCERMMMNGGQSLSSASISFLFWLQNSGRTIAQDYFMYINDWKFPPDDRHNSITMSAPASSKWIESRGQGNEKRYSLISVSPDRLAPGDKVRGCFIQMSIDSAFWETAPEDRIFVDLRYGCEGSAIYSYVIKAKPAGFLELFHERVTPIRKKALDQDPSVFLDLFEFSGSTC